MSEQRNGAEFRKLVLAARPPELSFRHAELLYATGWLATLEAYLKQPDVGLEHARVRVDIAYHFMGRKEFKTARPYAEAAGETGAQWAMMCASQCAEGSGDMRAAERWVRLTSERYESGFAYWYFWCV